MAFRTGKIELVEIKTGIGGKKVKTFSSVGKHDLTKDFLCHKDRTLRKKVKMFFLVGDGIQPRTFSCNNDRNWRIKVVMFSSIGECN